MIVREKRSLAGGLVSAALVLASGCSAQPGKPVPLTSLPVPVSSSGGQSGGGSSQRPRDIDIKGVDPCQVLTFEQEKTLDYDKGYQRRPQPGADSITNAPDCSYSSRNRGLGVLVSIVTSEGVEAWRNNPERATTIPPKQVSVAGFPALQITVPPSEPLPDKCFILVDVHDGQYLDVFASQLASSGPTGSATYCTEATRVAEMALATIESS